MMQISSYSLALVVAFAFLIFCNSFVVCQDNEFDEFDEFGNEGVELPKSPTEDVAKLAAPSQKPTSLDQASAQVDPESAKFDDPSSAPTTGDTEFDTDDIEYKTAGKRPELRVVDAPPLKVFKWDDYYIEILFVVAFILFLVNFLVGSGKNSSFVLQWFELTVDILKYEFALVGGAPKLDDPSPSTKKDEDSSTDSSNSATATKKQKGLIKSSESMYTLWCSGRAGMDGLLIEVNFLKRQDLLHMAMNIVMPSQDRLILRFLLREEGYDNFVFCLAHKRYAPSLARDMPDISTFCSKRKPISQYGVDSEKIFVMTELSDVASFILDDSTKNFVRLHEKEINFIHITDKYSVGRLEDAQAAQKLANPKRLATFSFSFPFKASQSNEYIRFSLALLDRLRKFKLARDSKQKSDKNRQKITDIIQKAAFSQRQEAAQNKKDELRRAEKERIFSEDDVNKQRAWEKKEAKREHKKKMRMKPIKIKP